MSDYKVWPHWIVILTGVLILILSAIAIANAKEKPILGPVITMVTRVYDGDTFFIEAHPWPKFYVKTSVRIRGMDAPEIRGKCQNEKNMAKKSRDVLEEMLQDGAILFDIGEDKYGRTLARVEDARGRNVAAFLIEEGLARKYDGGKREGWCD